MTNTDQRNQILETLNVLDQDQADKVLSYIKSILYSEPEKATYQKFKREAMKEIRKALVRERKRK